MAVTGTAPNNRGIKFRNTLINEFVRNNMFSPYMGDAEKFVIFTMPFKDKIGGDSINIPFAKALHAAGVSTGILTGNEEQIEDSGQRIFIDWSRNAVKTNKARLKQMSVDIYGYATPKLADWGKTQQRNELVQAFLAIPSLAAPIGLGVGAGARINGTLWSSASAAQQSAWTDQNIDRIVFGEKNANYVAGSWAASAANLTLANSRASAALVRLLKKKCETASPQITPLKMDDGYDRYVLFCGPNAFRDFEADPLIYAANKDARPREGLAMNKNPIFNDGDLLYHGVIIRKIPQIDQFLTQYGAGSTAGNGGVGVNVAPVFMCGQCAMLMPWGQLPKPTELEVTDYQFNEGKGIEMAYGLGKAMFAETVSSLPSYAASQANPRFVDWGCGTGFVASPDDA